MLCGEAYGGGRRKRGEKSDRLDYECTHRRTLFNVSLTFLVSISSPLTRSRWRDGQERRREMERGSGGRRLRSCCTPTKVLRPQTKSRVRVQRRASQSGGARIPFHSVMSRFLFLFFVDRLLCFLFRHPLFSIHLCPLSSHDLWPCYEVINAVGEKSEQEFLLGSLEAT